MVSSRLRARNGSLSACVLLRPGHSAGDVLAEQIKEEAAKTLPRTPTGNVQRFKLRQMSAKK